MSSSSSSRTTCSTRTSWCVSRSRLGPALQPLEQRTKPGRYLHPKDVLRRRGDHDRLPSGGALSARDAGIASPAGSAVHSAGPPPISIHPPPAPLPTSAPSPTPPPRPPHPTQTPISHHP